mmetsp:Transcript_31934/g.96306  ORF Transcript_31934/g.96306 Transcript_31934/m.96306 type:complete len:473 (+) Transcript_31934:1135-2553(+)
MPWMHQPLVPVLLPELKQLLVLGTARPRFVPRRAGVHVRTAVSTRNAHSGPHRQIQAIVVRVTGFGESRQIPSSHVHERRCWRHFAQSCCSFRGFDVFGRQGLLMMVLLVTGAIDILPGVVVLHVEDTCPEVSVAQRLSTPLAPLARHVEPPLKGCPACGRLGWVTEADAVEVRLALPEPLELHLQLAVPCCPCLPRHPGLFAAWEPWQQLEVHLQLTRLCALHGGRAGGRHMAQGRRRTAVAPLGLARQRSCHRLPRLLQSAGGLGTARRGASLQQLGAQALFPQRKDALLQLPGEAAGHRARALAAGPRRVRPRVLSARHDPRVQGLMLPEVLLVHVVLRPRRGLLAARAAAGEEGAGLPALLAADGVPVASREATSEGTVKGSLSAGLGHGSVWPPDLHKLFRPLVPSQVIQLVDIVSRDCRTQEDASATILQCCRSALRGPGDSHGLALAQAQNQWPTAAMVHGRAQS